MTKLETMKCEKLMEEAIINAKKANEEFAKADTCKDIIEKNILLAQAHNHTGYAEGINQVLAVIGFKHELMTELGKLISQRLE